ncbi:hypothetical protein [Streptomyces sp. YIM 98790]|nr:hypothetical protein [Streptomyces sp. YIM 98790]
MAQGKLSTQQGAIVRFITENAAPVESQMLLLESGWVRANLSSAC